MGPTKITEVTLPNGVTVPVVSAVETDDATTETLRNVAAKAGSHAVENALSRGVSVTVAQADKIVTIHPDGSESGIGALYPDDAAPENACRSQWLRQIDSCGPAEFRLCHQSLSFFECGGRLLTALRAPVVLVQTLRAGRVDQSRMPGFTTLPIRTLRTSEARFVRQKYPLVHCVLHPRRQRLEPPERGLIAAGVVRFADRILRLGDHVEPEKRRRAVQLFVSIRKDGCL